MTASDDRPRHPLHQLLRSHRRLEEACDALSIASNDRDVDTAAGVCAFFARQVRRHEEDEESSLFPRLLALPPSEALRGVIERLAREHRDHEALQSRLERVTTALQALTTTPDFEEAALWAELETVAELLTRGYRAHIEDEEAQLFPALELLSASALEEMIAEMDARRDRGAGNERA